MARSEHGTTGPEDDDVIRRTARGVHRGAPRADRRSRPGRRHTRTQRAAAREMAASQSTSRGALRRRHRWRGERCPDLVEMSGLGARQRGEGRPGPIRRAGLRHRPQENEIFVEPVLLVVDHEVLENERTGGRLVDFRPAQRGATCVLFGRDQITVEGVLGQRGGPPPSRCRAGLVSAAADCSYRSRPSVNSSIRAFSSRSARSSRCIRRCSAPPAASGTVSASARRGERQALLARTAHGCTNGATRKRGGGAGSVVIEVLRELDRLAHDDALALGVEVIERRRLRVEQLDPPARRQIVGRRRRGIEKGERQWLAVEARGPRPRDFERDLTQQRSIRRLPRPRRRRWQKPLGLDGTARHGRAHGRGRARADRPRRRAPPSWRWAIARSYHSAACPNA